MLEDVIEVVWLVMWQYGTRSISGLLSESSMNINSVFVAAAIMRDATTPFTYGTLISRQIFEWHDMSRG
jgi:hypothetical protein